MVISEAKVKIVIDNYFPKECNVNTSIREAFEKGFRIGLTKGGSTDGWISVTDRLPDKEEKYYLCYAKGGYQCICLWTDDIFGLCSTIGSFKNTRDEWGWSVHTKPQFDEITHWMPLPEPPKEVQDGN